MTEYVCDRCGKRHQQPINRLETPPHTSIYVGGRPEKCYDLCEFCMSQLDEFLEPLPQPAKPT